MIGTDSRVCLATEHSTVYNFGSLSGFHCSTLKRANKCVRGSVFPKHNVLRRTINKMTTEDTASSDAESHSQQVLVYLVHGTWPNGGLGVHHLHKVWHFIRTRRFSPPPPESRWDQVRSGFRQSVLSATDHVAQTTIVPYSWSGNNYEEDRVAAAMDLAEVIQTQTEATPHAKVILVGHSHGGTVCVESFRRFMSVDTRAAILGILTISTPFITAEEHKRLPFSPLAGWALVLFVIEGLWQSFHNRVFHDIVLSLLPPNPLRAIAFSTLIVGFAVQLYDKKRNARLQEFRDRFTAKYPDRQETLMVPNLSILRCAGDETTGAMEVAALLRLTRLILSLPLFLVSYFVALFFYSVTIVPRPSRKVSIQISVILMVVLFVCNLVWPHETLVVLSALDSDKISPAIPYIRSGVAVIIAIELAGLLIDRLVFGNVDAFRGDVRVDATPAGVEATVLSIPLKGELLGRHSLPGKQQCHVEVIRIVKAFL